MEGQERERLSRGQAESWAELGWHPDWSDSLNGGAPATIWLQPGGASGRSPMAIWNVPSVEPGPTTALWMGLSQYPDNVVTYHPVLQMRKLRLGTLGSDCPASPRTSPLARPTLHHQAEASPATAVVTAKLSWPRHLGPWRLWERGLIAFKSSLLRFQSSLWFPCGLGRPIIHRDRKKGIHLGCFFFFLSLPSGYSQRIALQSWPWSGLDMPRHISKLTPSGIHCPDS